MADWEFNVLRDNAYIIKAAGKISRFYVWHRNAWVEL